MLWLWFRLERGSIKSTKPPLKEMMMIQSNKCIMYRTIIKRGYLRIIIYKRNERIAPNVIGLAI